MTTQAPVRPPHAGFLRRCLLAATLLALSCAPRPGDVPQPPASGEWREFTGTWTASGTRRTMTMGGSRVAHLLDVRGTLVLSGTARPAAGFRAEAFVLNDSQTGFMGRAKWTDEKGDEVYSELSAGDVAGTIAGRIVGGTGRFAGVEGEYSFGWQFMIESEDGGVQGRTTGLKGRVRRTAGP